MRSLAARIFDRLTSRAMADTTPTRTTITQVAARAGVSRQTVSNFINGRLDLMSDATRGRVREAMDTLGYTPDLRARSLRSGRLQTLGFLILDEHPHYLADPLTDLMLAGVGDVTRDRGYGLLIQAAKPRAGRGELLTPLLERRVDGVFVVLSGERHVRDWHVQRLAELRYPFVLFDEPVNSGTGFSVRATNREGARELTEHLLRNGHRRIAFIAARIPWPVIDDRHQGYLEALRDAGIEPAPELQLFEGGFEAGGGLKMATTLLSRSDPPTAIMASSDLLAAGALQAAKRLKLAIPGDVAITGYDDFNFSELLDPPLTTVRVPAYEMGQTAAGLLLTDIEGGRAHKREVVLPVDVRLRGSA